MIISSYEGWAEVALAALGGMATKTRIRNEFKTEVLHHNKKCASKGSWHTLEDATYVP